MHKIIIIRIVNYNNQGVWISELLWLVKVRNSYFTLYKDSKREEKAGDGGLDS